MANISGVSASMPMIKRGYKKLTALGEGVMGDEFTMKIEGYSDLQYLVQSTQLPAMIRENIETYGPHGVQFNQQGRFKNAQDVSLAFKEVVTGKALEALRDWVTNKRYLRVDIGLTGESMLTSATSAAVTMEDCWIEIDGTDLSVEDGTALVKPTGTLHANWVGWTETSMAVTAE